MKRPSPPAIARRLMALLAPADDAPYLESDLAEAFEERCREHGVRAGRRWYWSQVISSARPLIALRLTPPDNGESMWHDLRADLHYAYRLGRRSWVSTLAVILTMTLGIGATTAVFSVVNAILVRPLPFPDQDRIVRVGGILRDGREIVALAHPDLLDFRRDVGALAELSAVSFETLTLLHGTDPQQIRVSVVDDAYARVLSLRPLVGRFLTSDDLRAEAPKVVVLSHAMWTREFGGDRSVLGRMISLDNESYAIIGVMGPSDFSYPVTDVDAFTPLRIGPGSNLKNRGAMWIQAIGKLEPGATIEDARIQLRAAASVIALRFPDSNKGIGAHLEPLRDAVVGPVHDMLILLAGVVGAVLLIACVNIANLLLGRSHARTRELAVRAALGGSASRIRRQLITESLGLALIGGVLGVAIAPLFTHVIVTLYPGELPRAAEIGVDWRVLALAVVSTVVAGLAAGLPAARRSATVDLTRDLRTSGRSATGRSRFGQLLVASQLALSLALVFAAGLLLRTFDGLTRVDPGFDPRGVTTFRLYPPRARYASVDAFYAAVENSIRAIPGVRTVATATLVPFGDDSFGDTFIREELGDQGPRNPHANIVVATPGFDAALGLRMRAGRAFTRFDDSTAERVVLINEALAKQAWAGVNPIGRYVKWNYGPHWRIVGIVKSVHTWGLWDDPEPQLYAPALQAPRRGRFVIVKADLPAEQVVPVIRSVIRTIDPAIPLTQLATMDDRLSTSLAPQRFRAALVGGLGLLALVLSVVGIYGVVGHSVAARTREIGIRMALGDDAGRVRGRIVSGALRMAAVGAAIGILIALAVGRWLSEFLVGVRPADPGLLAGSTALLFAVTIMAAYGPARRASRVDPLIALRAE